MSDPEIPQIPDTADELVEQIDRAKAHELGGMAIGNSEIHENPRNHEELAKNYGLDTSFLEEHRRQRQLRIFGQEELAAVEGHEASPESTQALVNAVKTLTQEPANGQEELKFPNARKLQRRLSSRDKEGKLQQQVWLDYYPEGAAGAAPNVSDRAEVDLVGLHREIKRVEGKVLGFEGDQAVVSDDLYVDKETGKAMLRRRIAQINANTYSTEASREATEREVQEALDLVTKLVQEETQRQTTQAV